MVGFARRWISGRGALPLLLLVGVASEAIYLVYFVRGFYLPAYYAMPLLDLGKITRYAPGAAVEFLGYFTALFVLYYLAYRLARAVGFSREIDGVPRPAPGGQGRPPLRGIEDSAGGCPRVSSGALHSTPGGQRRPPLHLRSGDGSARAQSADWWLVAIVGFAAVFSATMVFVYPVGAADIFDYVFSGHVLAHYRLNPFAYAPVDFPNDPLYSYPAWKYVPASYGPVWAYICGLATLLAGNDLYANLMAYKTLVVAAYMGSIWLTWRILKDTAPGYAVPGTLLFAWNPLVIYETAGNGHNDSVMMLFVLIAVYLLARRRSTLAIAALVLSALLKFVTAVLLPVFVLSAFSQEKKLGGRARFLGGTLVIAGLMAGVLYAPVWVGSETLGLTRRQEMFTNSFPTILLLMLEGSVGTEVARSLITRAVTLLLVAYCVFWSLRAGGTFAGMLNASYEVLFFYLTVASLWFQPWYLVWLVSLAALLPRVDIAHRTVIFCYSAMLSYFVFVFLWIWNATSYDIMAVQARAVAVTYVLPVAFTAYVLWKNRAARGEASQRVGG